MDFPATLDDMREAVLIPDDHLHARVLYLNRLPLWPWWRFPRLCDGFWRLYWHDHPGAGIACAGREVSIPARRLVLIPAGLAFATRCAPDIVQFYAHLDLLGLSPRIQEACFNTPWVAPEDPILAGMMDPLASGHERMPVLAAVAATKAVFFRALALWAASLPAAQISTAVEALQGQGRVARCLRSVEDDPGQPWNVPRLAALCGLSASRFSRVFHAEVGQPPARWIADRRLAVAAQRLLHADDGIDRIARACGFRDRHYFSRAFTRRFGVAPAGYRAQARAAAHGPGLPTVPGGDEMPS